jgi:hypothetical protein
LAWLLYPADELRRKEPAADLRARFLAAAEAHVERKIGPRGAAMRAVAVRDEASALRAAARQLDRRLYAGQWLYANRAYDHTPTLTTLVADAVEGARRVGADPDGADTSEFRRKEWAPVRPVLHMVLALRSAAVMHALPQPTTISTLLLDWSWPPYAVRCAAMIARNWADHQRQWPPLVHVKAAELLQVCQSTP